MPTSATGQAVDTLIRVGVHPLLKQHGFARKSRTWNRASGDVVHVVNIQGSQASFGEDAEFYVNTGVFAPALWGATRDTPPPPFVSEPECHLRERLDPPDPGADRWRLSIRDDPATEKTPLVQALEHTTLPFFAQFASLLDVRDYLRRAPSDPPRLELAMAEALLGDPQAARNLFDAFVAARPRSRDHIDTLKRRLDL